MLLVPTDAIAFPLDYSKHPLGDSALVHGVGPLLVRAHIRDPERLLRR